MSKPHRILFPLGLQLTLMFVVLLICSLGTTVWLSTGLFIRDTTAMIQQVNADAAGGIAVRLRDWCESVGEKVRLAGALSLGAGADVPTKARLAEWLARDRDLVALALVRWNSAGPVVVQTFRGRDLEMQFSPEMALALIHQAKAVSLSDVAKGDVQLSLTRLEGGMPAVLIAQPLVKSVDDAKTFDYLAVAFARTEAVQRALGDATVVRSYVVDRSGVLLAASQSSVGEPGDALASLPNVQSMLDGKSSNAQQRYVHPLSNEPWLSAFHSVGFGGLGAFAEVLESKAFEASDRARYRAVLIAVVVLSVFVFAGFLFSSLLGLRLSVLVDATRRIADGDFMLRVPPKGRDEITVLGEAFNEMTRGLIERDRVKDLFQKFHNREVAEKLLSGDVKLGGERREAVVLFSDIRGFTTFSEGTQPEEVVEMLNEYLSSMVAIIRRHGGVVDKFVGDAILALWGVPESREDEALRAVRAALEMRNELAQLNELLRLRQQPELKIGMGINLGPLIAGNIGSPERMEYTVIGDTVNLASRVESLTKEFQTDLLITESVRERLKDRFELVSCGTVVAKGKTEPTTVYQVVAERVSSLPPTPPPVPIYREAA